MIKIKKLVAASVNRFQALALKKRLILAGSFFLGIILLYLFFSVVFISRGETALLALRQSIRQNPVCHENCLLARSAWEQLIVAQLPASPGLNKRIARFLKDPGLDSAFKKELVKISALAYGSNNPPDYLRAYLNDPSGDPVVQTLIITLFSDPSLISASLTANWESRAANPQLTASERLAALKGLAETKEDSLITFYFSRLTEDDDLSVKQEAVRAISNISDKSGYFRVDQLALIKKLLLDSRVSNLLRADLVYLTGDYYPFFPTETLSLLTAFYKQTPSNDQVSRALAADAVNRLSTRQKLALPAVSDADWQAYYNH